MTEPSATVTGDSGSAAVAGVPAMASTARAPDWLLGQLPSGMLAEDFFVRFVRIFQAQAETLLAHADTLPHLADPRLAPPAMVQFMSRWLGTPGIDGSFGESAQRAMLLTLARTLPWRGTRSALERLLRLYSGAPARVLDSGGVFAPGQAPQEGPWVRLELESTGPLQREDFLTLVLDEIPAHVRAEIVVAGTTIWPSATDPAAPSTTATDTASTQDLPVVRTSWRTPRGNI